MLNMQLYQNYKLWTSKYKLQIYLVYEHQTCFCFYAVFFKLFCTRHRWSCLCLYWFCYCFKILKLNNQLFDWAIDVLVLLVSKGKFHHSSSNMIDNMIWGQIVEGFTISTFQWFHHKFWLSPLPSINKLIILQQFDIKSCLSIIFKDEW